MARVLELRYVLFAAVTCLSTSTLAGNSPESEKDKVSKSEWGDAVAGQSLSIATEKAAYSAGERIDLIIRFKNVGKEDVRALRSAPLRRL